MAKTLKTHWYSKTIDALQLAGMSESTQKSYARAIRMLIEHFEKDPRQISEEELQSYFLYRRNETRWSPSTLKICYCALKFFFINVLRRDWHILKILKAQPEKRLPCVLSRKEVYHILRYVKRFQNFVFLTTVYSCGLRLQEALFLEVSDIDSHRMLIHVQRGKGAEDRFVPLPDDTLILLRKYWKTHRHPRLLFPALGRGHNKTPRSDFPMAIDSVQGAFRQAKLAAGIKKRRVSIHTLRHSYATHLLLKSPRQNSKPLPLSRCIAHHAAASSNISARSCRLRCRPFGTPVSILEFSKINVRGQLLDSSESEGDAMSNLCCFLI